MTGGGIILANKYGRMTWNMETVRSVFISFKTGIVAPAITIVK
jgi:hypothetical protein